MPSEELIRLCQQAQRDESLLEKVRQWLEEEERKANDDKELLHAFILTCKDDYGDTPLHLLVSINKFTPPVDLIEKLLQLAPHLIKVKGSFGYLPLHSALYNYNSSFCSDIIVPILFEAYPEAAAVQDHYGWLPLRIAFQQKAPSTIIKMLFQAHPQATMVPDNYGDLPLHSALHTCASPDIIKMIFESYPRAAEIPDNDGELPLHSALSTLSMSSQSMAKKIFLAYPKAAEVPSTREGLPLHIALSNHASSELISLLLKEYPRALEITVRGSTNNSGDLPIHLALKKSASYDVIKMILQGFPRAAEIQGWNRDLPLHCACRHKATPDIIQIIFNSYTKAAEIQNKMGDLPLHITLKQSGCGPHDMINEILFRAYTKAAELQNSNGDLPLHIALNHRASIETIFTLFDSYPKAVEIENKAGDLPLHISLQTNASQEIIVKLFKAYSKAAQHQNIDGCLPIHYACYHNASSGIIKALFEIYPRATEIQNNNREFPLHLACESSHSVVKIIFNSYPKAAEAQDINGDLPLHIALKMHASNEIIKILFNAYPKAADAQNNYGELPLHCALWSEASSSTIMMLFEPYQKAVQVFNKNGDLPLHIALKRNASHDITAMLLEAYPQATQVRNNKGNLPLHYACVNRASVDIIRMILDAYRTAPEVQNNKGELPLHLACESEDSRDAVMVLLERCPAAAQVKDNHRNLPLHIASKYHASPVIIKMLLEVYPKAAEVQNIHQVLPLHTAVETNPPLDSVIMLMKAFPKAAEAHDNDGALPLHYACYYDSSPDVVKFVLEGYPKAVEIKDSDGDLPLHIALKKNSHHDTVMLLLQAYPKAAEAPDIDGALPLHYACNYNASSDVIKKLFEPHPKAVEVQDKNGDLPLHIALRTNANHDAIRLLLESYPKSVSVKNKDGTKPSEIKNPNGMLLLHYACFYGFSDDLLQVIVNANTKACLVEDYQGRKPWQLLKVNGAASRSDEGGMFPMHRACRYYRTSLHYLKLLLDAYPDCIYKNDATGKTPSQILQENIAVGELDLNKSHTLFLHRVCSDFCNEGSVTNLEKFVTFIINAYPEGKKQRDGKGRIPLHHACAYANSSEVLKCLVTLFSRDLAHEVINMKDVSGATPLCVLIRRTDPKIRDKSGKKCPEIVEFIVRSEAVKILVEKGAEIDSGPDNEVSKWIFTSVPCWANDPFYSNVKCLYDDIAFFLYTYKCIPSRKKPLSIAENLFRHEFVPHRLQLYLQLKPQANNKFYILLQRLRDDDLKNAVLDTFVQNKIQEAVKKRLPTLILMLDFDFILAVLICFGIAVSYYNEYLYAALPASSCQTLSCLYPQLYTLLGIVMLGGVYFLIREVMQILSLVSIGHFWSWLSDPANFVDVICIIIMLAWPILMCTEVINRESNTAMKETFRSSSTLAAGFLFLLVFSLLKRIFFNFAVFVRGFIIVFYNLASFLVVLFIIITAFALMFYSMFQGSIQCSAFCTFWSSWFEVFTMILGNYGPDNIIIGHDPSQSFYAAGHNNSSSLVDEGSMDLYLSNSILHDSRDYVLYLLYILFGIIVIIVLLNLLIAVVVDSYEAVKNDDSEEVFWSSRLEYVMEVEVMSNWFRINYRSKLFDRMASISKSFELKCSDAWESLVKVYEDKRTYIEKAKDNEFGSECKRFIMPRVFHIIYIGIWLILGVVTAGLLWPPQIREWLWARHGKSLIKESGLKGNIQEQKKDFDIESTLESIVTEITTEIVKVKESIKLESNKIATKIIHQNTEISKAKLDIVDVVGKKFADSKADDEQIIKMIDNLKAELRAGNEQLVEMNRLTNEKVDQLIELVTKLLDK